MVERFHRQLKAAIRCHENNQWTRSLPIVLLGIRAAWREDIQATSAELVYGEPLRLPGEFIASTPQQSEDTSSYVKDLRRRMQELQPTPVIRHGQRKIFVFKDLRTTSHVLLRHDAIKNALENPYDGPYLVISRGTKDFVINNKGKEITVSIDRLKPAYILHEGDQDVSLQSTAERTTQQAPPQPTDSQSQTAPQPQVIESPMPSSSAPPAQIQRSQNENNNRRTKRRVRFTERYQAGFN
ncbi:uncharacterized protein LOC124299509 [Neodiprion virginianus]|uniref:uncharacterized protein LOC124299509 n=1 Tax=Neodiprion virginianus TaxID=2961670 RepID=UPI001EE6C4BB|nr:uncharacterized protein LOC124299509 [Neodiprion virginianus]